MGSLHAFIIAQDGPRCHTRSARGAFQLWGRLLSFPGPSPAPRIAGPGRRHRPGTGPARSGAGFSMLNVHFAETRPQSEMRPFFATRPLGDLTVEVRAASTLRVGRIHSAYGPRPLCLWAASTLPMGRIHSAYGPRPLCLRATSTLPTGRIHSACGPHPLCLRAASTLPTGRVQSLDGSRIVYRRVASTLPTGRVQSTYRTGHLSILLKLAPKVKCTPQEGVCPTRSPARCERPGLAAFSRCARSPGQSG